MTKDMGITTMTSPHYHCGEKQECPVKEQITVNIDRLTAVLSDILTDKYDRKIMVTTEGTNVNNDTDSNNPDPGKRAWFPDVRNVV